MKEADEENRSSRTNSNQRPSLHGTGETNTIIVMEKSELFNKLVSSSTSTTKNFNKKTKHNVTSLSHDMQGPAQKCVDRYSTLAHKTRNQSHRVSTPCLDDHFFQNVELETVGALSEVCAESVLNMLVPSF